MESIDDDICILSSQDALDGSVGSSNGQILAHNFVISPSASGQYPGPAVQALQQAYTDLKKRFNETITKNHDMSRALRDVNKSRMAEAEMATYGVRPDSMNAQGAAATAENVSSDENQRAQQGYIRYLEREKINQEAKLRQMSSYEENVKAMQVKLKYTVRDLQQKEADLKQAHETIKNFKEANVQLQNDHDLLRKHTCDVQEHNIHGSLQSSLENQSREMDNLRTKYNELEVEYNKVAGEGDRLKVSHNLVLMELQAATGKLVNLEKNIEVLTSKNLELEAVLQMVKQSNISEIVSMPTAQEMIHLKKVIADLRRNVLLQKEFLSKLGTAGALSLESSGQVVAGKSMLPTGKFRLGQSWENLSSSPQIPVHGSTIVEHAVDTSQRIQHQCTAPESNSSSTLSRKPGLVMKSNSSTSRVPASPDHSQSEVLIRRTDVSTRSPRNKSEVVARASDIHWNRGESPTHAEPIWQQQQKLISGMGRCQSTFDNNSSAMAVNNSNTNFRTCRVPDDYGRLLDNTPAFPVPLELEQTSPEPTSGDNREKVCPVCSRDFSTMPMDDFQTHVFECFDDQSAPETIRRPLVSSERICPMCNALFSGDISQEEFEKHVQTHFKNDLDQFEMI